MAVTIVNYSDTTFTLNGIEYQKNFQSIVTGDNIKILNVYDSTVVLQINADYSEYTVDGSSYASASLLQSALVDILFYPIQKQIDSIVSGYKGVLLIADTPLYDGYYMAGESGFFTNAGNLSVDLNNGITFIDVSESQTVFTDTIVSAAQEITQNITENTYTGAITNLPDEEDITEEANVLKLKDRDASFNNLGYKIIRADFDFTTDLTSYANSIWEIRYAHDLTANITLPLNVTLKFNGGKINLGGFNLTGTNTKIHAGLTQIFDTNGSIIGDWNIEEYFPEWFGALGDGVQNDVSFIQKINDLLVNNQRKGTINLSNKAYLINSSLDLDISYVSINSNGSLIDASNMTTGYAINITGSVNPPYKQSTTELKGFELEGNDRNGDVIGIKFDTPVSSGNGNSHISLNNITVHHFNKALYFGSRAYAINISGSDFYQNSYCVYSPVTLTDGGERLSFNGCTFFNSNEAVNVSNPNSGWHFSQCSFDYNGVQFTIDTCNVTLMACHIESGNYSQTPFVVSGDGGSLSVFGGWFLQTGTSPTNDYTVDCSSSSGGVYFDGVFMNNILNNSGYFATGSGFVRVTNNKSYGVSSIPLLLSESMNKLSDGSFEESSVYDDIFISSDTQPITDRVNGGNIDLSTSSDEFRTGTKSLKINKMFGGGSECGFTIAVPISSGSKVGYELYYKKPSTNTGTVFASHSFATFSINSEGIPVKLKTESIGSYTLPFTSTAVDWTQLKSGQPSLRTPTWATHYIIVFNMNNFVGDGSIYLDDINISEL